MFTINFFLSIIPVFLAMAFLILTEWKVISYN